MRANVGEAPLVRFSTLAIPAITSIAVLFGSTAQAMDIQVYDRMSVNDQGDYTGVMIKGAERVLTEAGRADQAAQVEKLFTTRQAGNEHTLGMVELELNMSSVRQ